MRYFPALLVMVVLVAGCTGIDFPSKIGPSGSGDAGLPPGYSTAGVNASVAESLHERRAVETGSLTLVLRIDIVGDPARESGLSENISAVEEYRVDFRNESLRMSVTGLSERQGYLPPGGDWLYVRTPRENPSVSPYTMRGVGNLTRYANPRLDHVGMFAFVDALNFTYVHTRDGRARFEAIGFDETDRGTRLAGIRPAHYRNVSATLVVDGSGRVHRFAFEGDAYGPRGHYRYTYSLAVNVSNYGKTAPSAPDWLDAARETYDD